MSGIVKQKKKASAKKDPQQSKFNRLVKKVASMKEDLEVTEHLLNDALSFHLEHVVPAKMSAVKTLGTCIISMYDHYKNKTLSKAQNETLKEMLIEKIQDIYDTVTYGQVDPKISDIYADLTGIDFKKTIEESLEAEKREAEQMFREHMDLDVDLSNVDLNIDDDEVEIQRKIFAALRKAAEAKAENEGNEEEEEKPSKKPKSKRALAKELEVKELEDLQKKGINTIYKQLAKAFHPDLEACPTKKIEKEGWMKKLTAAYESEDFHTLLSLQLECLDKEEGKNNLNPESFKVYNNFLDEQVAELEMMKRKLISSPRYMQLHPYFDEAEDVLDLQGFLEEQVEQHQDKAHHLSIMCTQLQGNNSKVVLKNFIREYLISQEEEEDYDEELFATLSKMLSRG